MTFISQGKRPIQSKTIIFAILTGVLATVNALTGFVTDPTWISVIGVAVAGVNVALRFLTEDPIVTGSQK